MQRDHYPGNEGLEAQVQTEYSGAKTKAGPRTSEEIYREHRYRMSELEEALHDSVPQIKAGKPQEPQYTLLGLNVDPLVNSIIQTYQYIAKSCREYVEKVKLRWARSRLQRRIQSLEEIEQEMEVKIYGNKYQDSKYGESRPAGGQKKRYLNLCIGISKASAAIAKLKDSISKTEADIEELDQEHRKTTNGKGTDILEKKIGMQRDRDDLKNKLYGFQVSLRYAIPLQKVLKKRNEEIEVKYKALQQRLIEAKVRADQSVYECDKEINELFALATPDLEALNRDEQHYVLAFRVLEGRNLRETEKLLAALVPDAEDKKDLRDEIDLPRRGPIERLKVFCETADDKLEQDIEKINNGTYQF